MNCSELDARFGLGDGLRVVRGEGGLILLEVDAPQAQARIALQGAQLLHWQPRGERGVIWLSEDARYIAGKSVRGGIPVCWPWFGAHASQSDFPAHGFARTRDWELCQTRALADGAVRLVFALPQASHPREWWAFDAELELRMTIGQQLELELITRNRDTKAFKLTQALHTYFAVSDVREVEVRGLEDSEYLDTIGSGGRACQQGAIRFAAETDRIYQDGGGDCLIIDPAWKRRIRISKQGSASSIVWNPWVDKSARLGDMGKDGYLGMLCVESANADQDARTLAAGTEHVLKVCYRVEPA